jgi:uncharacterized repeat protein (TIGR03803 family)
VKMHLRWQTRQPLAAALGLALLCTPAAWSRSETVLWNFSNSNGDGGSPSSNSIITDSQGNLFGVTQFGGSANCITGCGVVFELSPNGADGYNETILHDFTDTNGDGAYPPGGLVFDAQGNLYGVTSQGGANGTGTIYELSPTSGGGWTETILYNFGVVGGGDATYPRSGLIMDTVGNLYGAADGGGTNSGRCGPGCGTVFELSLSGGAWTETILHRFRGAGGRYNGDGAAPNGLAFDAVGNLYGTTYVGGTQRENWGTVFRLKPTNTGWAESVLHSFTGVDGFRPYGNVVVNRAGDIFGTCNSGGTNGAGTAWELVRSGAKFTLQVLYNFSDSAGGAQPGGITMNGVGNMLGGTELGGSGGSGTFYKLIKSGNTWNEKVLYNFTGGADGGSPSLGPPLLDASGNIFGLAVTGGTFGDGVAFELTP